MVRVLGVETAFKPEDLHILVNGEDIMETIVLDTLLITGKKVEPPQPPIASPSASPVKASQ